VPAVPGYQPRRQTTIGASSSIIVSTLKRRCLPRSYPFSCGIDLIPAKFGPRSSGTTPIAAPGTDAHNAARKPTSRAIQAPSRIAPNSTTQNMQFTRPNQESGVII